MLSKRCTTSAKGNENCSSAAVTNRMACQSRCEIQVQASHRRNLTACSKLSTPRNRAVWGLGCRSACQLSKRITDDYGRARTCPAAPAFNSPCRRSQTLRREVALVNLPKNRRPAASSALAAERTSALAASTCEAFLSSPLARGSLATYKPCGLLPLWSRLDVPACVQLVRGRRSSRRLGHRSAESPPHLQAVPLAPWPPQSRQSPAAA